ARPPAPGPHPKGLRKKLVAPSFVSMRTGPMTAHPTALADRPGFAAIRPAAPLKDVCRSLRAIPTFGFRWTHRTACPHDRSHAASPQGFLTRRILPSSRCVWLTNAIDRIVKEAGPTDLTRPDQAGFAPGVGQFASITFTRRCRPV